MMGYRSYLEDLLHLYERSIFSAASLFMLAEGVVQYLKNIPAMKTPMVNLQIQLHILLLFLEPTQDSVCLVSGTSSGNKRLHAAVLSTTPAPPPLVR